MSAPEPNTHNLRQEHAYVWEFLPWYVNHSLDAGERQRVEAHISMCLMCQAELSQLRRLEREIRDDTAMSDVVERGLAATRQRLDSLPAASKAAGGSRITRLGAQFAAAMRASHPGIRALLAAQAAALVIAVTLPWMTVAPQSQGPQAPYQTLSDTNGATSRSIPGSAPIRVKFHDGVSEQVMRQTLLHHGFRIVDGPSPTGFYTLVSQAPDPDPAVFHATVRDLQAVPAVAQLVPPAPLQGQP